MKNKIEKNEFIVMSRKLVKICAQKKVLNNISANYFVLKLSKWYIYIIIFYNQIHNNFNKKLRKIIKCLKSNFFSANSKKWLKKDFSIRKTR